MHYTTTFGICQKAPFATLKGLLPRVRMWICQVYPFSKYVPVEPFVVHRCSCAFPAALALYRASRQPAHKVALEREEDDQRNDHRNESASR